MAKPLSKRSALKLTVVVSAREGHGLAVASLRSILADDALPFELIYLDNASPAPIASALAELCAARGGRVVRYETPVVPTLARKAALASVRTPFVAFVDNDILVHPGCFERLVACAEATGAGIVGPLYLIGGDGGEPMIHMAGGLLHRDAAGAFVREEHLLIDAPARYVDAWTRRPVDFVEYHCLVARTDLLRDRDLISGEVLTVHEHIALSLAAREAGAETWLEPAAKVLNLALAPTLLHDLDFYRWRWNEASAEASLAAFARRWPSDPRSDFFGESRKFVQKRLSGVCAQHPLAGRRDLDRPMAPAELAQTRTALREQAISRGYAAGQVRGLEAACDFATLIFDGVYRADGRPFLNHVIGTASALIRYEMRQEVVLAGLLHAAYTHRPDWIEADEIARVLASGGATDRLVRALPTAKAQLAGGVAAETLTFPEGLAIAIEAANEADMLLAGEYRASGRPPEVSDAGKALMAGVLGRLGAPGLALTALGAAGEGRQGQMLGFGAMQGSFRLDARNRRLDRVQTRSLT